MNSEVLILYSRKGCCLCEALETRLLNISLRNLSPSIELSVVDIDNEKVSTYIQGKYTNEVPVIVLESNILSRRIELPRVPPRLKEELLLFWIQNKLNLLYKTS